MMEERVSRGLAVGDLDDDGRLDIVTNDLDGAPQIIRNEIAAAGNWLLVRLKGRGLNTGAIGAVVTARAGSLVQRRLVQSGSSYISQEDKRLHFGLGKAGQVDSLEVTWPDGTKTTMAERQGQPADRDRAGAVITRRHRFARARSFHPTSTNRCSRRKSRKRALFTSSRSF